MKKLSILGDYNPLSETHAATDSAIGHAKRASGIDVDVAWVGTDAISDPVLTSSRGFLVAPGSPYKDMEKALWAIEYARVNNIPILGTCGGFQHMIIAYARNVLGFKHAHHAEYDPGASDLFISKLTCSLRGREMDLDIAPGSKAAALYGTLRVREKYYCNFGVNPDAVASLRKGPLRFVGSDSEGELRILEYPGHRFFIGTLFVPQIQSTAERPHPLVTGLLEAVLDDTGTGTPAPARGRHADRSKAR